jgi:hypothetical protein
MGTVAIAPREENKVRRLPKTMKEIRVHPVNVILRTLQAGRGRKCLNRETVVARMKTLPRPGGHKYDRKQKLHSHVHTTVVILRTIEAALDWV